MAERKREIKLTDDPLTNIHIMVPMLDKEGQEAVSHLMYGYYLGRGLADKEIADNANKANTV
ncbi:MAG: hypothetical protein HFG29_10155 [Eubacterium sp.]|nr:hypothetical protein [Eubacterium sp.]